MEWLFRTEGQLQSVCEQSLPKWAKAKGEAGGRVSGCRAEHVWHMLIRAEGS